MKEIKTVALVGLGAIGAYFADRLQPVLGDDLRVIAGGARAERIRREGLVINGKQEYYHVVEPGEGEPADLVIFATKMSGLQQAIEDVRAQIGPETLILSPLNGVESEEVVAKTYGWENIVYSLMRISSVKVGNTVSFDPNAAFYVEYGEKKNDPAFCEELAALGEAYVNDAFGTAHRAHASTAGVAALLPAYAGYLMQREVATLSGMLEEPRRPFAAILGGSKVSDKIKVIDALMDTCDTLVIGGGMCFTFLFAQGKAVGTSLKEEDWVERAAAMIAKAEERGVKLLLPVDVVVADRFAEDAETLTVSVDDIPDGMMGLDIGPETAKLYADAVAEAKTVFWNGPMGVFEMAAFEAGTKAVAEAVAANADADTVIGGGDSVAAVNKFDLAEQMTFISTGGGASMELVQGEALPGVEALR